MSASQTVTGVVALGARASGTGLSTIQFQVSGQNVGPLISAGACTTSWDTTSVSNGSHTVTAVASDSVGNTVWAAPLVVDVLNTPPIDGTSPVVGLTAPAAGATIVGIQTLSATASDNVGVVGVWFVVDGATVGAEDTSAPYLASWSTATVGAGSHVVAAHARDAAGNIGTSTAVVVSVASSADVTGPTVGVTAPTAGATVSGLVTLTAAASDNVGMGSVQFTVDGVNVGAIASSAPYASVWDSKAVADGTHRVRAIARDAAGNLTLSAEQTFAVKNAALPPVPVPVPDTIRPTVRLTSPVANATIRGTVGLVASATDNVGVVSVRFTVDGVNTGSVDASAPWSVGWNSTNVTDGVHTVKAIARDAAGNEQTSAAVTVVVANRRRGGRR